MKYLILAAVLVIISCSESDRMKRNRIVNRQQEIKAEMATYEAKFDSIFDELDATESFKLMNFHKQEGTDTMRVTFDGEAGRIHRMMLSLKQENDSLDKELKKLSDR